LVFEKLRDSHLEGLVFLERVVELGVGLGQSYIYHGKKCLLDTLGAFKQSNRKLLACYRLEDGWEEGCVKFAYVGHGDRCRGTETLGCLCVIYV
jgi:hypothetical protein